MSTFQVDFFEIMFLAETCIPPQPIARSTFWISFCDVHYHKMSEYEKKNAFDWLKEKIDLKNKDCQYFYDRFNPDNQYKINTSINGKDWKVECFKHEEKYHTFKNTWIQEKFITNIEKI